eukprot:gnl/Dysnectes_brevis/3441_a4349_1306.p1 GENE.gnl/Dysnectes_brevis/3441_a4349_1306~~gnl/Dysnectes_brevis/3441_a4349_1306.p1  ORF type:complete len:405 (+),score=89.32 gnl/Dysnectes_brevis/3441_a4349_1306:113-1216(+)
MIDIKPDKGKCVFTTKEFTDEDIIYSELPLVAWINPQLRVRNQIAAQKGCAPDLNCCNFCLAKILSRGIPCSTDPAHPCWAQYCSTVCRDRATGQFSGHSLVCPAIASREGKNRISSIEALWESGNKPYGEFELLQIVGTVLERQFRFLNDRVVVSEEDAFVMAIAPYFNFIGVDAPPADLDLSLVRHALDVVDMETFHQRLGRTFDTTVDVTVDVDSQQSDDGDDRNYFKNTLSTLKTASFLNHLCSVIALNAVGITSPKVMSIAPRPSIQAPLYRLPTLSLLGSGIYTITACINHSCEPVARTEFSGSQLSLRCDDSSPVIPPSTELTISYIDCSLGVQERRHLLLEHYFFNCECPKCVRQMKEQ